MIEGGRIGVPSPLNNAARDSRRFGEEARFPENVADHRHRGVANHDGEYPLAGCTVQDRVQTGCRQQMCTAPGSYAIATDSNLEGIAGIEAERH